jgi:hypothetical protein
MVGEPSHVKQLSLNHVCKIGLKYFNSDKISRNGFEYFLRHLEVKTCKGHTAQAYTKDFFA